MTKSENGTIGTTNLSSSQPTTIGMTVIGWYGSCHVWWALHWQLHQRFSQIARNTYAHCIAALQERYGRPTLIITLRAELSTVRQEEGESMNTFGDPDLVNAPTLLQSLAVPAFLRGLRDRNAAQEAMKFRNPKSIQEALTHIQGASRIFGNRLAYNRGRPFD